MLSCILPYFVSAASQQQITSHVNRSDAFTLGNALFEPSDDWTGVFCKTDDRRRCTVSRITVTDDKYGQQDLGNGQVVPMLGYTYTSPPTSDWPSMFIKGFPIKEGEISNVLAEQQRIPAAEEPQRLPDEPVSLAFGTETYQFRVNGLDLVIEERGKTSAQQRVPLFIDPDKRCDDPRNGLLRRDVALYWMGDLDGDGRADFLLWASAYRSCALAILRWDPEHFLILSSRGAKGEVGMVYQPLVTTD
jgi:hypothetical protein